MDIETIFIIAIALIVTVMVGDSAYSAGKNDIVKSCETVGKFYVTRGSETKLYSCSKDKP